LVTRTIDAAVGHKSYRQNHNNTTHFLGVQVDVLSGHMFAQAEHSHPLLYGSLNDLFQGIFGMARAKLA
jgi:hypothetical protein